MVTERDSVSESEGLTVTLREVESEAVKDMVRVSVPVSNERDRESEIEVEDDLEELAVSENVCVSENDPVGSERERVSDSDSVSVP